MCPPSNASDSLASLQQLQTVVTTPQEVSYYPHHVLLHAIIVEEIMAGMQWAL